MPWKDWRSQVHISGVLNFTICVQNHNKHFSQKPESYKSTVCPINTKMAPQNHKNILCLRNYPNHSTTQSCKCKLQSPPTIAILSAHTEFYEQRVDKFQAYLAFSASCSIPSFLFTSLKKGQQSQLPFFFPHIHDVWAYVTTSVLLHSSAVTFPAAFTFSTVRQQLVLQDSLTVIPIFSIVGIYISYVLNRYFSPLYLFMYDKTFTAY